MVDASAQNRPTHVPMRLFLFLASCGIDVVAREWRGSVGGQHRMGEWWTGIICVSLMDPV